MHDNSVQALNYIDNKTRKKIVLGLGVSAILLTLVGALGVVTDGLSLGPSLAALYGII